MRYLTYTIGTLIVILASVLMINNKTIVKGTSDSWALSQTTYSIECTGANNLFVPTSVLATISIGGTDAGLIDDSASAVVVTGPVAGGATNIGVSGGTGYGVGSPFTTGNAYMIFESPQMRHIYACQENTNAQTDLKWSGSAPSNMQLAYSNTGSTTTEADFTLFIGSEQTILANLAVDGNAPFFTAANDALRMAMTMNADNAVGVTVKKDQVQTITSTPKP